MNKTPEQKARDNIDRMLERSGWAVVDKNAINWTLGPGVAVREYQTDVGPADYVLTNPPFGKKSSITITNGKGKQETEELRYNRQDFWATTSNKQLNFVQHVRTMLKTTSQAAVVVPDNVLFEGGVGS